MGGLFRAPKPVIVQSPAPPALPPTPVPAATPQEAIQAERSAARARLNRGLAGTIATSARGVLSAPPVVPAGARKTLLGD